MMRRVCSSRSKIHQEEINDDICIIYRIALRSAWTDQQLVKNRSGMALDSLLRKLSDVDYLRGGRRRSDRDSWWDLEAHHQDLHIILRVICNSMLRTSSEVGEIIGSHRVG